MAEDTKTEDPTTEAPAERTVPYARFKEVNDRLAAEKQARNDLEERMASLEDRDKTDVERLTKEREKLEKRAAEAEQRASELEAKSMRDAKASLVERAAAKLNFHDPGLASQLVALDEIDDAKAADAAVKTLAKERGYLVRAEPSEGAKLRKVGVDGQTIDEKSDELGRITEEEQRRQWGEQLYGIVAGPNTGAVSGMDRE